MSVHTRDTHSPEAARRATPETLLPGLMIVIAGAAQGDGALITAAYRGTSPVPEDQLSFPWDGATAVTTSLVWGATQVLLVLGLVAFARSGAAAGRSWRAGSALAVAGAGLYVLAHAISAVAYDATLDSPVAILVLSCFGVGTLLTATGLLMAGAATLRSQVWSGWRRYTPVGLGVWMVVMLPLQFTAALPLAVGIYAVAVIALGIALAQECTRPAPPMLQR